MRNGNESMNWISAEKGSSCRIPRVLRANGYQGLRSWGQELDFPTSLGTPPIFVRAILDTFANHVPGLRGQFAGPQLLRFRQL